MRRCVYHVRDRLKTKEGVVEIAKGSMQQEVGEGSQVTCEDHRVGTGD